MNKIVYIITKSNFGGAQKYVYEIATALSKRENDILVILGGNGLLKNRLEVAGIKTASVPEMDRNINPLADIKTFFKLIRILIKEKPNVVHLNSSKAGGLGALAARVANLFGNKSKIIFTIHGWAFNENRNWFVNLLIKKIYWITICLSHKSIAISDVTKNQLSRIPLGSVLKNKVVVIKNSIREVNFLERDEARKFIIEKIGTESNSNNSANLNNNNLKIIGSLAELHPIKGIDYFIGAMRAAVSKNPNIIAVVFGEGEERNKLEAKIQENNLSKNFFLMGFIEDASKYLKAFDTYVCSSLSEGLSLVLLEARQAGIKIVATNVGGNKEALENYQNAILVESKNVVELEKAINRALEMDLVVQNNNYQSFDEMLQKTLEVYKK